MPRPAHRLTPQRRAILDAVQASGSHPTAAQIFAEVRARHPRIAFGTVYKALHLLSQTGQIQQLEFGDTASRYDRRVDRHDHAICTNCGRLMDIDVPLPPYLQDEASTASGFRIAQHSTQFYGLCPDCQGRQTLSNSIS